MPAIATALVHFSLHNFNLVQNSWLKNSQTQFQKDKERNTNTDTHHI